MNNGPPLTSADFIPDEPLDRIAKGKISDQDDLLNHRAVAGRVAELAATREGKLNIALFGPWGSGKSSFFGLLKEELERVDTQIVPVIFDAWRNSGSSFHANFLNDVARQVPGADKDVAKRLFQSTRTVNLPFRRFIQGSSRLKAAAVVVGLFLGLFVAPPLALTLMQNATDPTIDFWVSLATNIRDWSGFAMGTAFFGVAAATLLELSKVTVEQSAPSYVTQFGQLFDDVVKPGIRCVVFIDELDRCSPANVMLTLEGLRTFLGHDRCIFVVAFDREAVSATIAGHLKNVVPHRDDSPYYETSGEYLDKIFQFQVSLPPQRVHTFRRYALPSSRDEKECGATCANTQNAPLSVLCQSSPRST